MSATRQLGKSAVVDVARERVIVEGTEVALAPVEWLLLMSLLDAPGGVLVCLEAVPGSRWDDDADAPDRRVSTHMASLRRKLGPAGDLIERLPWTGYRLRAHRGSR